MDEVVNINDITVIQLICSRAKKSNLAYLYLKKEKGYLVVLNIPPYLKKSDLDGVFKSCGKIKQIYFEHGKQLSETEKSIITSKYFDRSRLKTNYRRANIHFEENQSVEKALKLSFSDVKEVQLDKSTYGLNKWMREYSIENTCDMKEAMNHVNEYISAYDKKVQEDLEAEKAASAAPDEDGWVLVTRAGKNKGAPRTQTVETKVSKKDAERQKQKELNNFYGFQKTNEKRERVAQLRQKFQEDRMKINQMKAQRKFRPY